MICDSDAPCFAPGLEFFPVIDLRSMCMIEHILECRVVVVRVRSRGRVGEERSRVQKLVEVMGLGLITCGEGEDVSSVHTLLSGVVQVCHELLVGEEEEKEKEQGRQEEREVKGEGQSEETAHTWMTM